MTVPLSATEISTQRARIAILGMRCAACAQLIEFRIRQMPGVQSFTIQALQHRADMVLESSKVSVRQVIAAIVDLGYGALPDSASADLAGEKANKQAIWRLFIAGFAMMQVMMLALPAYMVPVPQIDGDLTPDLDYLLKVASLIVTLPVLLFSAQPFFKSAWRDIRNRHIGMDVPVTIGIVFSFIASVWATQVGGAVYYDSVIMFVFLLLAARMLEEKVNRRATAALSVLTQFQPVTAQRLLNYPGRRETEKCLAVELRTGDFLQVETGAQIPADGVVVEGETECDEALMTGESVPVLKQAGDVVIAGAINMGGAITIQATQVGDETALSHLVRMMEKAATEKPPLVQLADKHASRFLSAIMLIAVVTGFAWWHIDAARAIWIALSVIVVTCPCALSLATPGVMSAAVGQLAKNGVLIAKGRAIESLARADHFVFDKTGTLTEGKLKVAQVQTTSTVPSVAVGDLVFVLSSISTHPVSKALTEYVLSRPNPDHTLRCSDLNEVVGKGLQGKINGKLYRLGTPGFVQDLCGKSVAVPAGYTDKTLCVLGDSEDWIAIYALEDSLRADTREALQQLKAKGKKLILLSGDRQEVVDKIALNCGFSAALGGLSPEQKHDAVKKMQEAGAIVAMIGDGMNDGPVLSLANVSVAMGQGAPITQARSDVLLMTNRLSDLDFAVDVSSKALRLIRQNLGWALVYNLLAIPAAVSGLLLPWHAALGMSLSSVLVVLNSLRLLRLKPKHAELDINTMSAVPVAVATT